MAQEIDIKGLDKAELLAALYNNSKPLGLGFLQATAELMTKSEAQRIIDEQGLGFDYLQGRVMKINLEGDTLDPWGYDRDNGSGSVAKVVADLKSGTSITPDNTVKFAAGLVDFVQNGASVTAPDKGSAIKVIKLKNGSEEAEPLVLVTMASLTSLWNSGLPGMLAIYDLAEVCKGRDYEPFGNNLKILQDLSLLQRDGKPHDSIRNIVLSAVQGEGLNMQLSSPVATTSQVIKKNASPRL